MKKLFILFLQLFMYYSISHAQGWIELGGTGHNALDANDYIYSVAADNSGNIYAAGTFSINNYVYVAIWNGTYWSELGSTPGTRLNPNGYIQSIAVDRSGNVYAGGGFTDANGKVWVGQWNGSDWIELGTGSNALNGNGAIWSPIVIDKAGNIYVAGQLTDINGNYYVAKWNGITWSELGNGISSTPNEFIQSVAADSSGNIYAAGNFTDVNGNRYVAKWDGTSWSELGTGTNALNANNNIVCLATDRAGNIYAAGQFTNPSGKYYVAKWDGTSWSELGVGTNPLNANSTISTLTIDGSGNVYAAGDFTDANATTYVAKWDETSWSELGTGTNALNAGGSILTVCLDRSGNVYAAGRFYDSYGYNYVAQYIPSITTGITSQLNNTNISIFPNPGAGIVHFSEFSENVQLNVSTVLGETVVSKQINAESNCIDLSNLGAGVYTLLFTGQNSSYAPIKWVKE